MTLETHRKALRAGLPWIVVALVLLGVSVALSACLLPWIAETAAGAWVGRAADGIGALGSVAMAAGIFQVSRARIGGEFSIALRAAFPLWLVELLGRARDLAFESDGDLVLAIRIVAASSAMLAFSSGMTWLLVRRGARQQAAAWRVAWTAFLGLAALIVLALAAARFQPDAGLAHLLERIPYGAALAWLVFVLPWLALVRAVRRSIHWVARGQTIAEVLTS
jgi:hypothetical protein